MVPFQILMLLLLQSLLKKGRLYFIMIVPFKILMLLLIQSASDNGTPYYSGTFQNLDATLGTTAFK